MGPQLPSFRGANGLKLAAPGATSVNQTKVRALRSSAPLTASVFSPPLESLWTFGLEKRIPHPPPLPRSRAQSFLWDFPEIPTGWPKSHGFSLSIRSASQPVPSAWVAFAPAGHWQSAVNPRTAGAGAILSLLRQRRVLTGWYSSHLLTPLIWYGKPMLGGEMRP